jgi:hypothetical protein
MRPNPRVMFVAMLSVFALGPVAAAGASASEFVFSKTGTLKGEQVTAQVWKNALGVYECTKDKVSGSTTVLKSPTQIVIVQYEGCNVLGVAATATPAEYELNASGAAKLLKAFSLNSLGECKITFPVQNLSKDTYKNFSGKVEVASAMGMKSFGENGPLNVCEYSESPGSYEGVSLIELVGGTMEVK